MSMVVVGWWVLGGERSILKSPENEGVTSFLHNQLLMTLTIAKYWNV